MLIEASRKSWRINSVGSPLEVGGTTKKRSRAPGENEKRPDTEISARGIKKN